MSCVWAHLRAVFWYGKSPLRASLDQTSWAAFLEHHLNTSTPNYQSQTLVLSRCCASHFANSCAHALTCVCRSKLVSQENRVFTPNLEHWIPKRDQIFIAKLTLAVNWLTTWAALYRACASLKMLYCWTLLLPKQPVPVELTSLPVLCFDWLSPCPGV